MKILFDPLISAWVAVITHKLRSALTILGVVIGVSCVIILMSIGEGTQLTITNSLNSLGPNLVFVQPGSVNQGGIRGATGSALSLTLEDSRAIAATVPNVSGVAPSNTSGAQVIAGNQNMFAAFTGVTPDYGVVNNIQVVGGDFINQDQYNNAAKIALIGSTVSTTLFSGTDPLGKTIRIGNNIFRITGILQSKGSSPFNSTDNAIFIPLSTFQEMVSTLTVNGQHVVAVISIQATSKDLSATVKNDVTALLRSRHQIASGAENDFTVTSLEEISNTINTALSSITLLLAAIAGISLLVGGIGVMNIMLVSVMERRREIGIRKALGAKERDIWGQFLVDAALLTFFGGIVGVAIGWGISSLITTTGVLTTVVSPDTVFLAVGVSVGIGIFFGFLPAWQASRLDPIQALRSE